MTKPQDKVLAEYQRFEEALSELMKTLSGRWVVFQDGAVKSDHESRDEAMRAAIELFGLGGGHVVARVAEIKPTPLTAAVMFGHGP